MGGPPAPVAAVRAAVRRCLCDVAAGGRVLVACSGGPDSLALAAAAAFVAPRLGLAAGGVTVDHGLQEDSESEARRAEAAMRGLGLEPVERRRVEVGGEGGPEGAARRARYAALEQCARRHGAVAVLLAHTRDDQAETVLLGLARGSGARSLAAMAPRRGLYRRPLLGLDRGTVRRAAEQAGMRPWHDPHNDDARFARVRTRREVLPTLERALGPGVAAALARTADLLRDDAEALESWADRASQTARRPGGGWDVAALAALPRAVRTRVLRGAALEAGAPASAVSAEHVAALDALVARWRGQGPAALPGGLSARRDGDRVIIG